MQGAKTRAATAAAILFAAGVFLIGPTAQALTDEEAEALYGEYHRAIEIARLCKGMKYSESDHAAMAGVIEPKIENRIGTKRLKILTAAQRDARVMVKEKGCDHYDVRQHIILFEQDLKPVL